MYKRVQAVAVMYAAFILVFSVLQGLIPGFNFIDVWFNSFWLQALLLVVFWFVSPILINAVERIRRRP